jgi:predicted NUDIX family NTP pyrophosphohydrolase
VRRSAGLLLHRGAGASLEVLVGHMGGPYWARKDEGGWSVPKGEHGPDEEPLAAAAREFAEELGLPAPDLAGAVPLGEVRQSSGKVVAVWALAGDLDPAEVVPGTFALEWPPRSGRLQQFPELDRVAWLAPDAARAALVAYQRPFVDRLEALLR